MTNHRPNTTTQNKNLTSNNTKHKHVNITTTNNTDCIFCKITQKQAPATILHEDNDTLAFLDIRPLNQGHTLIIPKTHYETIYNMPEPLVCHIHKLAKRFAVAVKQATKADGITIIQQNGAAAGQEIFHLHVHIVPRYEGQKLPHFHDIPHAKREQLEQVAQKIRQQLQSS